MKASKLAEYRLEGMVYAVKRIRESGIDAFEKELEYRTPRNYSVLVKYEELKQTIDDAVGRVKNIVLVFALAVLHDEFDFDADQCRRFADRFNLKTSSLANDDLYWDEQVDVLKEELGIEVQFK